jgi:hypothetical protein
MKSSAAALVLIREEAGLAPICCMVCVCEGA